jgi:hypothetical protein
LFRQRVAEQEPICRLPGLGRQEFLVASHIKPWRDCDNREMSSDIRFWSSGDTKTGPPDGLLIEALRRPLDRCFIGGCRVVVVGCGTYAA